MTAAEQLERIERPLRHLLRTVRPVIPAPASPDAMFESAVRAGVEARILAVVSGSRGERLACIAEACGKDVVRAMVPPGRVLEPEHLSRFLGGPEIDAVSVAHAELSTGTLVALEDLARVVRRRDDILLLVDGTWSVAADPVEFDLWQLDFLCTGSEQALGLVGGPALACASKRLLARAESRTDRGWALDLLRLDGEVRERRLEIDGLRLDHLERRLSTLADMGGVEGSWERAAAHRAMADAWVDATPGAELAAPPGRRAAALSVVRRGAAGAPTIVHHPAHRTSEALLEALEGLAPPL